MALRVTSPGVHCATMLRDRVLPAGAVFVSTMVVTGALTVGVYARGLAFTLGPLGALAHAPAVALLAALSGLALIRLKGLTPSRAGLTLTRADALDLAGAAGVTAAGLVAVVAVAAAVVGRPLARGERPVSLAALGVALVAFVGSAAVQQLTTQSLALAASPATGRSRGGVALAVVMFTLAHVQVSSSTLYLTNVALFALVSLALFDLRGRRAYALPVGFHAGWNFAQVALLGAPTGAPDANPLAPWRWPSGPAWVFGGAAGLDEGALFTALMLACLGAALAVRRRGAEGELPRG